MTGLSRIVLSAIAALSIAGCGGGGGGGEVAGKQDTYTVGGTVSGLTVVTGQPALTVTISNQSPIASAMTTINVSGNSSFAFPAVATGTDYRLIITSPTGYTCVFANANNNGTVGAANVSNLNVTCTAGQYSIGGQVTGLGSGNPGLQLSNATNTLQIAGDGPFTFTQTALNGATYNVVISVAHPQFECSVVRGTGTIPTANVNDIFVSCATTVRVNVTGLGAGSSIHLINDYRLPGASSSVADSQLTVTGPTSGTFATRLPSGAQYAVRVLADNPNFQCSVANSSGTVASTAVTLNVTCTPVFTIGGIVRGLMAGRTLVLRNNGTDTATVTSNGAFTFPTSLASGASYLVSIGTQPSGETCWLGGGYAIPNQQSGTVTAQVTDILVSCGAGMSWTWIGGSNTGNGAATFGTKGTPSRSNIPRATLGAVTWTDPTGVFWLFGGEDSGDMWKYTPSTWAWTWVSGPGTLNPFGVYGPKGAASPLHRPGTRTSGVSWRGSDGKLWLFGGNGFDAANQSGSLNDLWVFDPADLSWTWVTGSGAVDSPGIYGTKDSAATSNTPGARTDAAAWTDSSGNLWLFGGYGVGANGQTGSLNDLWRFRPSDRTWTWKNGSDVPGSAGTWGSKGSPNSLYVPSARYGATTWIDSGSQIWIYGGYGYDSTGVGTGLLNDLWLFRPTGGEIWIWVSGSSTKNQVGNYGTLQASTATTVPGARRTSVAWVDSAARLWLFGGLGLDSTGNIGKLDDLWMYDTGLTSQWTWKGGRNVTTETGGGGAPGVYGTLGVSDPLNLPGARQGMKPWRDSMGEFWMFGGQGFDANGSDLKMNDLWRFRTN